MPVPLETQLMQRHQLKYAEARRVVLEGRIHMGLPKAGPWNEELRELCLDLVPQIFPGKAATTAAQHQQQVEPAPSTAELETAIRKSPSPPRSDQENEAPRNSNNKKNSTRRSRTPTKKKKVKKKTKSKKDTEKKRSKSVAPELRPRHKQSQPQEQSQDSKATPAADDCNQQTLDETRHDKKPTDRPTIVKSTSAGARLSLKPTPNQLLSSHTKETPPLIPGSRRHSRVHSLILNLSSSDICFDKQDNGSNTDLDITESTHGDDDDDDNCSVNERDLGLFKRGGSWKFAHRVGAKLDV